MPASRTQSPSAARAAPGWKHSQNWCLPRASSPRSRLWHGRPTWCSRLWRGILSSAEASLPGVLLTQSAASRALCRQGMDLVGTPPVAVAGHSQGVLAVEALRAAGAKDVELLAMAQLIGAAATL